MTGTILRMRYEIMQELDTGPIFTLYRARDIVRALGLSDRCM